MSATIVSVIDMMKRLLITLRHPGPAQAIASILPNLAEKYKVYIAASNTGLEFLLTRCSEYLYLVNLFVSKGKVWVKYTFDIRIEDIDNLEYDSSDKKNLEWLTLHLAKLISECSIDIVLRTTPAINWGLDEIAADACAIALERSRCICYQEDYACGNNLENVSNPIAVVDDLAGKIITAKGMRYYKVGWINQALFLHYPSYKNQRNETRRLLQLEDENTAILYAMGATGAFTEEIKHFKLFLEIKNCKLFYKFHPRNSSFEREIIRKEAKGKAVEFPDNERYEAALSFSDYIISVASAMNQDTLQYQIETGEKFLCTNSVYTKGKISNSIICAALGNNELPQLQLGMGSILIAEEELKKYRFQLLENKKNSLYEEARKRYGLSSSERIGNMLAYIEGVK